MGNYKWEGQADIVVRIPQSDGGYIELHGKAESIDLEVTRDVGPYVLHG